MCKYRLEEYERSREAKRKEKGFIANYAGRFFVGLPAFLKVIFEMKRKYMFCKQCNMVIHESEIKWHIVHEEELPFCPVHKESLIEVGESND